MIPHRMSSFGERHSQRQRPIIHVAKDTPFSLLLGMASYLSFRISTLTQVLHLFFAHFPLPVNKYTHISHG